MKKTIAQSDFPNTQVMADSAILGIEYSDKFEANLKVILVRFLQSKAGQTDAVKALSLLFADFYTNRSPSALHSNLEILKRKKRAARVRAGRRINAILNSATANDIVAIVDGVPFKATTSEHYVFSNNTVANKHGVKIALSIELKPVVEPGQDGTNTSQADNDAATNAVKGKTGSGNSTTSGDDKNRSDNAERDNALAMTQSVEAFEAFCDSLDPATFEQYKNIMVSKGRARTRTIKKEEKARASQRIADNAKGMETTAVSGALELS